MRVVWSISVIFLGIFVQFSNAFISDYLTGVSSYFGYKKHDEVIEGDHFLNKIPYEVSTTDEKFLQEAAKLTGVALSELDSCQQRVVLKLQTDCHKMNDEQLAKMAVHLLNCQSFVEGRKIYPCTEDMSIRSCTTEMDSDTWTSYHLMSNRARAVCYSIRQNQFRGLAEHTVNKLMDAARDQLNTLTRISAGQDNIQNLASETYDRLDRGHKELAEQQKNIEKAQFHGQLAIEDNIRRLIDEKKLILETHNELVSMTKNVQAKLEKSADQLDSQSQQSRLNHKELIEDLIGIQEKARSIFERIDESAKLLVKQNEDFRHHYEATLKNLAEVNKTVTVLVSMVGGTRQALEERLSWIVTTLGGTDVAVERLYLILWHLVFLLASMLACAFLSARLATRIIVTVLPVSNLLMAFYGNQQFDALNLIAAESGLILLQWIIRTGMEYRKPKIEAIKDRKNVVSSTSREESTYEGTPTKSAADYSYDRFGAYNDTLHEEQDEFDSFTPPLSRIGQYSVRSRSRSETPLKINGSSKGICHAKTRAGTPCKLSSMAGRDFCFRHQTGSSVMS